jgi:ABC-2 type transport system permease protein
LTLGSELKAMKAVLRRDLKLYWSYKGWVVISVINPLAWFFMNVYSYLGLGNTQTASSAISSYGGIEMNFVGFIMIGTIVYLLYRSLLWGAGMSMERERWQGTLEMLFLAPVSRITILIAAGISSMITSSWWLIYILVVGWFLSPFTFNVSNWFVVVLCFGAVIMALVALGIFFASFFILTRAADQLATALQSPIRFFTGVATPVAALPSALQAISYAVPVTWGIAAVRIATLAGGDITVIIPDLLALLALTFILILMGYYTVGRLERSAKRVGTLAFY